MDWPPVCPLVVVEWVDSRVYGSWRHPDEWNADLEEAGLLCRSTGWLFRQTEASVVLMQSQNVNGGWSDAVQIPRSVVRGIRVLEAV